MLAIVLIDRGYNLAYPTNNYNSIVRLVGIILALIFELVKSIYYLRL